MTHTTNTSMKAMENSASTGEETHTDEGATAAPPGNAILIIKPLIHLFNILEWFYLMLKAQNWTGP